MHRLSGHDSRGDDFNQSSFVCTQRTFAVNRLSKWVDHTTEHSVSDGNLGDTLCTAHLVSFLDSCVTTEDHDTDVVFLKVEGHPCCTIGKFNQLSGSYVVQAVDACDAVPDEQHGTYFGFGRFLIKIFNLLLDDRADLFGS